MDEDAGGFPQSVGKPNSGSHATLRPEVVNFSISTVRYASDLLGVRSDDGFA
jgi:hypothetical protein